VTRSAHNNFFELFFGEPDNAMGVLAELLPPEVLDALDLARARRVDKSFVDPRLQERRADLLFTVPVRDGEPGDDALVYILWEHRAADDLLTPLTVLGYMVRCWESWLEERARLPRRGRRKPPRRLPPIVPVVLFQGRRRMRTARRLVDALQGSPSLRKALAPFTPDLDFILIDLPATSYERIPGPPEARFVLTVMRLVRIPIAVPETFARALAEFAERADLAQVLNTLRGVLPYVLGQQDAMSAEQAVHIAEHTVGPEAGEEIMNAAQRLIDRGLEQGIPEGQRRTILRLLQRRFGPLSPAIVDRVDRADSDTLDRWADRLLDAQALDDVFHD